MNRLLLLAGRLSAMILMSVTSLPALAQGTVVTGIVTDHRNIPIVGVRACQVSSTNCTVSDINGVFHLVLDTGKEKILNVTCPGFNPAEAVISDTTTYPVRITLIPMYVPEGNYVNTDDYSEPGKIIVRSSLNLSLIFSDFSEFSGLLGTYNTDAMDYFSVTGPEIGASFSGFYTGLGIGFGYRYEDEHDSLAIDLNNTLYKLILGYDVVNSSRIRMTPVLSVNWLKFRLQNYPDERRVPLENYLADREIDLRFNQVVAMAGLNLEYKFYSGINGMSDYWSLGIYGGYAVKLNRKPWIRSDGNRITTDNEIRLKPFTAGISVSFYTR
ncbi:MAG: hypothetical protein KBB24_06950 [Bacteroidales bacterium]|nr:hypothetical protein [Bacteroidales bacterium]MDX9926494.1 hypothetical protein [Bacteroidales bacterium]HNX82952.1 hypothetical protein [Bacteroidales bacterium]HOC49280.1 hypothetical protein [Bacteroidales bacterium]HPS96951.1 hypothetical protein [Bacteroidales bacterium]